MHSTEGKRLEPPKLIHALGCSEAKAWNLGAWTENDAHMAYEYVPC